VRIVDVCDMGAAVELLVYFLYVIWVLLYSYLCTSFVTRSKGIPAPPPAPPPGVKLVVCPKCFVQGCMISKQYDVGNPIANVVSPGEIYITTFCVAVRPILLCTILLCTILLFAHLTRRA
jgi:hypothetical protein